MGAFFDRLTAFGQPLTIAAVLMRIGVAVVMSAWDPWPWWERRWSSAR